jgi:hypothetical protein
MRNLETTRLTIRSMLPEDAAELHRILDLDLQWSGPEITLEKRRESDMRFPASSAGMDMPLKLSVLWWIMLFAN